MENLEVKKLLTEIVPQHETTQLVKDLEDGGKKLVVEQRFIPRDVVEHQRRNHTFYDAKTFSDYLKKYGGQGTVVAADYESMTASAVLDELSRAQEEVVRFKASYHPVFKAMMDWIFVDKDEFFYADEFVGWLRNFSAYISGARELIFAFSQVKASADVQAHEGVGRESLNGVLIKTSVKSGAVEEHLDLPETITVRVPIFQSRHAVEIQVSIFVDVVIIGGKPTVKITLGKSEVDVARMEEFENLISALKEDLDERMIVGLGRLDYEQWKRHG